VTAMPPDPPAGDASSLGLAPSEPPPRLLPRWLWGLSGIGLFLAGAILGAVLMASVTLYQLPASAALSPNTSTPAASAAAPTATLPVVRTIAPTDTPLPTRPPIGPGIGQQAPPFTLFDLDGITYTLSAYQGQTVILNFWASWCPPCRTEWPEIRAFADSLTSTDVVLLAVNVEEAPEVIYKYVGTATLSFPVLLDPDGQVSERYHATALPTTILIDPAGLIRQVIPGPMDAATLRRLVHP